MRQLKCEMCGSVDLVKKEGVFVCQSCGTKYSTEEARKLMIDGTVDVQGTVSIDNSQRLDNLIQLAQRAKSEGNSKDAQKYYDMILLEDTENWEAVFYHVYFQSTECKIGEIATAAIEAGRAAKSALIILSKGEDKEYIECATVEIETALANLSTSLINASINQYAKYREVRGSDSEYIDRVTAVFMMLKSTADTIWESSVFNNAHAVELYTLAMTIAEKTNTGFFIPVRDLKSMESIIVERIRTQNPDYETLSEKSSGGCYIATAVYGSYDCPQVWTLRRYRDSILAATWYGRTFIHVYYAISPVLVDWLGSTAWFKKLWKRRLDCMVANLQRRGIESTPYKDQEWR